MKKGFFSLLTLCIVILSFNSKYIEPNISERNLDKSLNNKTQLDEENILINKNSDFAAYAQSGNGTKINPYIINNLIIKGLSIIDINAYFVIQNLTINGLGNGFYIYNSSNGIF
jgi:hypothetical protein